MTILMGRDSHDLILLILLILQGAGYDNDEYLLPGMSIAGTHTFSHTHTHTLIHTHTHTHTHTYTHIH